MIYTPLIQKAILFALQVHAIEQDQRRRNRNIPFITHPLGVGLILARVTDDEKVIASGILHDTIEDSIKNKKVTYEQLGKEFGKEVADMVQDVTEDKKIPWVERKALEIDSIRKVSLNSLFIKAADMVHNIHEYAQDFEILGKEKFIRLNGSLDQKYDLYKKKLDAFATRKKENPLYEDLEESLQRLKVLFQMP